MPQTVTREQLHALVWAEPTKIIAKRFGISDVALAKACRRLDIPLPQRGYWAKVKAGKAAATRDLPARGIGMAGEVTLGAGRYGSWRGVSDLEVQSAPIPPVPHFAEALDAVRERARKLLGRVRYVRSLESPHPAVRKLLAEDEARRQRQLTEKYFSNWDAPFFDSQFERRRLSLLNSLFTVVAKTGGSGSISGKDGRDVSVSIGSQTVRLAIDARRAKLRDRWRDSWRRPDPQPASTELRFQIELAGEPALRTDWEDKPELRLENQLPEIAVELMLAAEVQYRLERFAAHDWLLRRKSQLEEEAKRRAQKLVEAERQRNARLQQQRVTGLLREATALSRANEIRNYVDAVLNASRGEPPTLPALLQQTTWKSPGAGE